LISTSILRGFNVDPKAAWLSLLHETPVSWSEHYGGFWIVADHAANYEVLQNTEVFTSERVLPSSSLSIPVPGYSDGPSGPGALPMELDPPHHGPVRGLLNTRLSPAASRKMQPIIEEWTTLSIDSVIEAGECDLLYDVLGPVRAFTYWPVMAHSELAGIFAVLARSASSRLREPGSVLQA
jgi:cytochrome P450